MQSTCAMAVIVVLLILYLVNSHRGLPQHSYTQPTYSCHEHYTGGRKQPQTQQQQMQQQGSKLKAKAKAKKKVSFSADAGQISNDLYERETMTRSRPKDSRKDHTKSYRQSLMTQTGVGSDPSIQSNTAEKFRKKISKPSSDVNVNVGKIRRNTFTDHNDNFRE
jgi:hypothetical protein